MHATRTTTHLENLDRRGGRIEHILPTLATKDDLAAAIAPLATKEELRQGLSSLEANLRGAITTESEQLKHHMNVLLESYHGDIQILAEHVSTLLSDRGQP